MGCVSQDSFPRKSIPREQGRLGSNTPSNSPKAPGKRSKFGKERVQHKELSQSVRLMSVVLARQNSRKVHMRKPCTKNDAQNSDKTVFHVPGEVEAMLAPTSKRPEERKFVVDSGASMHMLSKKDLRRSRKRPCGGYGQWRSANKRGSTSFSVPRARACVWCYRMNGMVLSEFCRIGLAARAP